MLTGRMAFGAPTMSDTLAGVLERDPNWDALPEKVPPLSESFSVAASKRTIAIACATLAMHASS
jgi:hypothetical protein